MDASRRFVIGREKPGEQSEVAQLIQQTLEQERWQREMMEQRYNQYMDEQEVSHLKQDRNPPKKEMFLESILDKLRGENLHQSKKKMKYFNNASTTQKMKT